jgi:ribosomal protein L18
LVQGKLKKKSNNPLNILAAKLVGEKMARRLRKDDVDELLGSITLSGNSLRKVTKPKS